MNRLLLLLLWPLGYGWLWGRTDQKKEEAGRQAGRPGSFDPSSAHDLEISKRRSKELNDGLDEIRQDLEQGVEKVLREQHAGPVPGLAKDLGLGPVPEPDGLLNPWPDAGSDP